MIDCLYDCFKHWAESGSVYIISDTHFEDSDCKLMDPKWLSPEEHIDILKSKCHKSDTLIVLGDVGNPVWFDKLKCYKVLIKGNHDAGLNKYRPYFNEVYGGPLYISNKILISHEPIITDYHMNIHGHDHSGRFIDFVYNDDLLMSIHYNVASNVNEYQPLNLKTVLSDGYLNKIGSIHRKTIDAASKNKLHK